MSKHAWPYRLALVLLLGAGLTAIGTSCASKGYVRQETQKTATTLSARIDTDEKAIQQNTEQIKANTNQIGELVSINKQTTQRLEGLNSEVQRVDTRAGQARSVADQAQQTASQANTQVVALDTKFQNRNRYTVVAEKFVYFKFNSDQLDKAYEQDLIEVAGILKSNPDAILAVEGRTDNSGDPEYNIRLGERREDAVIRFLVVQQGVPMIKVYKMSFGAANPIADNQSRDGRAKNRCAAVRVLGPPTE
jgi:outer membrane protein OmpA-like peptidoglycan-associated protein